MKNIYLEQEFKLFIFKQQIDSLNKKEKRLYLIELIKTLMISAICS